MRRAAAIATFVMGCGSGSPGTPHDAASDAATDTGGAQLAVTPTTHSYGVACLGGRATPVVLTITNVGSFGEPVLLALAGTSAGEFSIDATTCATTIAPTASCTVTVGFHPTSTGAKQASFTAATPSGSVAVVSLDGSAAGCSNLSLSPSAVSFGSVEVGDGSASQTFTITSSASAITGPLTVTRAGADPSQFEVIADTCSGITLTPTAHCGIDVRFRPTSAGPKSASLDIAANPGGTLHAQVSGIATPTVVVSPSIVDFGAICISQSFTGDVTITNNGTAAEPIVLSLSGGDAAMFTIDSTTCTQPVAPGSTCVATVRARPAHAGAIAATFTATLPSGPSDDSFLSATGLSCSGLLLTPGSATFGMAALGSATAAQSFTVTNPGGSSTGPITIGISGSAAGDFEIAADPCSAIALGPGASCAFDVRFRPTAAGSRSAVVSVVATPGGSRTATLQGDGVP